MSDISEVLEVERRQTLRVELPEHAWFNIRQSPLVARTFRVQGLQVVTSVVIDDEGGEAQTLFLLIGRAVYRTGKLGNRSTRLVVQSLPGQIPEDTQRAVKERISAFVTHADAQARLTPGT